MSQLLTLSMDLLTGYIMPILNYLLGGYSKSTSAEADHITLNFLKAVFHKFYLVHS